MKINVGAISKLSFLGYIDYNGKLDFNIYIYITYLGEFLCMHVCMFTYSLSMKNFFKYFII